MNRECCQYEVRDGGKAKKKLGSRRQEYKEERKDEEGV